MRAERLSRYNGVLLLLPLINAAYIAEFASPTFFGTGNVVLHPAAAGREPHGACQ
jgi:hypothetical protein